MPPLGLAATFRREEAVVPLVGPRFDVFAGWLVRRNDDAKGGVVLEQRLERSEQMPFVGRPCTSGNQNGAFSTLDRDLRRRAVVPTLHHSIEARVTGH